MVIHTQSQLKELLNYDPNSGVLTWKVSRRRTKAGAIAGSLRRNGYVELCISGKMYQAHRLAWLCMTGDWPEKSFDIDHIDMVRSNNSWNNLRLATRSQNKNNSPKHRDNTSGYKGVYFEKSSGKWKAQIMVNYKNKNLGRFPTKQDAYAAYCIAAPIYHHEFARVE